MTYGRIGDDRMMTSTEVRADLIRALRLDLVGPGRDPIEAGKVLGSLEEVLDSPPTRWYLTGFLAPANASLEQRSDEEPTEDMEAEPERRGIGDDGLTDRTAAKATPFPSSLGLSFLVSPTTKTLKLAVRWGDYRPSEERGDHWVRQPKEVHLEVELPTSTDMPLLKPLRDSGGLELSISVRQLQTEFLPEGHVYLPGTRAVSAFVVNRRRSASDAIKDLAFAFQAELEVHCETPFIPRLDLAGLRSDDLDDRIADLQYRDEVEFAVGHGAAAEAEVVDGTCRLLRTVWVPVAGVERVQPSRRDGVELRMEALAELADFSVVRAKLGGLVALYRHWIQEQAEKAEKEVKSVSRRLHTTQELKKRANAAADRIERGIQALEDPLALDAFRTANRVMAAYVRRRKVNEGAKADEVVPTWYPFQIAFVLLNMEGIVYPAGKDGRPNDREIVDLLFFPTGGGKTEAYLGLAAITLLLRRLRNPGLSGAGVAVLMRYTLRLLTLDQLGRAASVICALELERAKDPAKWGTWPFEIGLWVGQGATPNILGGKGNRKEHTAVWKVDKFKTESGRYPSPIPLESCPWCGTTFKTSSFNMVPDADKPLDLRITCPNQDCEFKGNRRLPIVAVDEAIYRRLPCFLIATVDKFAAMPWTGQVAHFFGRVETVVGDGTDIRHGFHSRAEMDDGRMPEGTPLPAGRLLPPDLVIQDELHLISGPLGTMVGLYETALEELCKREVNGKVIPPKIVASTATVRRSEDQVRALFARPLMQVFPPQGPDRRDSFFAEMVPAEKSPARLYMGIAAQGRNPKTILLRTYLALMGAGEKAFRQAQIDGLDPNPADPYMTLLGYFNALKELGGARRIIEDEVQSRLRKYAERRRVGEKKEQGLFSSREMNFDVMELTSRVSTADVAKAKKGLEERFVRPTREDGLKASDRKGVDVGIATNMISVGLDITRLGLMAVFGQPKTTSEYIQATSRVGRDPNRPGLVVTILNLHKPRDRSHFERFGYYHRTFYRAVEASSVTPFSPRALDRGLAGTVVALARLGDPEMSHPLGAKLAAIRRDRLNWIVDVLRKRVENHANQHKDQTEPQATTVADRVKDLLDAWAGVVLDYQEAGLGLQYQQELKGSKNQRLLHEFLHSEVGGKPPKVRKFRANRSLRDVEPNVKLWMKTLENEELEAESEGAE